MQSDSLEFCNVIRNSIAKLCLLDHKKDKLILDEWLKNKTVENCAKWINDENSTSLVAEINKNICGVAHIGHDGTLFLCYLLPEVKGKV